MEKEKIDENKQLRGLMKDELYILEEITHPHIMRIYELLEDDDFYFIVSEYIRHGELYDFV